MLIIHQLKGVKILTISGFDNNVEHRDLYTVDGSINWYKYFRKQLDII